MKNIIFLLFATVSINNLISQSISNEEYRLKSYFNRDSIFLLRGKIDDGLLKLWFAYPEHIKGVREDALIWKDNSIMLFRDTFCEKLRDTMLVYPDLDDMMGYEYDAGMLYIPDSNCIAGRVRYEPFFRKMYGNTKEEVLGKLAKIAWVPKIYTQFIYITKVNNIHKKLQKISSELQDLPKSYHKYLKNIGGTFNWRPIKNTNGARMSLHSFAIAIDISTKHGKYWDWEKDLDGKFEYQNEIPLEIVQIFEKYGFIWGGRWHNFDTMHFEYRPELLLNWGPIPK